VVSTADDSFNNYKTLTIDKQTHSFIQSLTVNVLPDAFQLVFQLLQGGGGGGGTCSRRVVSALLFSGRASVHFLKQLSQGLARGFHAHSL
jgi:hypothetical protein